MSHQLNPDAYEVLRHQIASILSEGRERARLAVEQEKVQTYWKVGQTLGENVLEHRQRAGYGNHLIARLAQDLQIGKRQIYQMLQFYRSFPNMPTRAQLGWGHYRALLPLPSNAEREFYLKKADHYGWTVRQLEAQVQSGVYTGQRLDTATNRPSSTSPLPPLRGHLYSYRLIPSPQRPALRLDLGFGIHLAWPLTDLENPRANARVEAIRQADTYHLLYTQGRAATFYTYRASVIEVIDGDTLWLDIDCGFGVWTRQKVRLRGIDTPELTTSEGQEARAFVAAALRDLPFVIVTTTKPDKYGRYLADIFYGDRTEPTETVLRKGTFLNQILLKSGLAKRWP